MIQFKGIFMIIDLLFKMSTHFLSSKWFSQTKGGADRSIQTNKREDY